MTYQAKWGPKGFLISPEKIVTFDGFSTSIELNDDSEKDTSGTPPTNTKGKKPQNINLSINYLQAAGVDPRAQFEEWTSLVGKAYPFYISGKRFGPEYLRLKKIDLSGLKLSNDGSFLSCTVAVSLEEHTVVKQTTTPVKTATPVKSVQSTYSTIPERTLQAYQQKEARLLQEKEEAMEENYEILVPLIEEANRVRTDRKYVEKSAAQQSGSGGGGGYVYRDDALIRS